MCTKPFIITIDGPAGTGKSTVAKGLATALDFTYFDTGALYRAISWELLRNTVPLTDVERLQGLVNAFTFHIQQVNGQPHYFVAGKDVTQEIRTPEVTAIVSEVSTMQLIRDALKPLQLQAAQQTHSIFEGRDLGTAIFPQADLKFFLTASVAVRARRRYQELQEKFPTKAHTLEEVTALIEKRDYVDSNRKLAPLKQAHDALLIDTSDLTIPQVIEIMKKVYMERVNT